MRNPFRRNKKVYVVEYGEYSGRRVVGIHSSLSTAKASLPARGLEREWDDDHDWVTRPTWTTDGLGVSWSALGYASEADYKAAGAPGGWWFDDAVTIQEWDVDVPDQAEWTR